MFVHTCVTTFVGELHLHECQSSEWLAIWEQLHGKVTIIFSLFLDADIVLCGASTPEL